MKNDRAGIPCYGTAVPNVSNIRVSWPYRQKVVARGSVVVETPRYKSEGRGFGSRTVNCILSIYLIPEK
jgi:hypothetical protein